MLERIRACLPALPPAEQRVAKLLLADARGFAMLPVAELAAAAGVSKPTVVRFCRSIGYQGLADFKLKLQGAVNEGVPFVHRSVAEGDRPAEMTIKVIDNAVAAMLKLRNSAADAALARAIEGLAQAARAGRRIEFYGVGNSGIVAMDAQHKFFRLGIHTAANVDSHVQVMSATLLGEGDCALMFSNAGRSREVIDAAAIARRARAQVMVVTASDSPLAHWALTEHQVLIAIDHPEDAERYSPMVSRLLHLLVVDVLATGVALALGPAMRERLQAMKRNLKARQAPGG